MNITDREFVTKERPCKICRKPDFCSRARNESFHVCRRCSFSSVLGVGLAGNDNLGKNWFFRDPNGPSQQTSGRLTTSTIQPRKRSDDLVLNAIYSWLLQEILNLSTKHQQHLLNERGLSVEEIKKRDYRSMPSFTDEEKFYIGSCAEIRFNAQKVLGVPGFARAYGKGVFFSSAPGLLIPVRDGLGRIVALKIRRDNIVDGPRYLSVSSIKYGGSSPGSRAHVPLFNDVIAEEVILTEGELKADIATALTSKLTISCPGVSVWRSVIPELKGLQTKTVTLAFDMDAKTNPRVANALAEAFSGLKAEGYITKLITWEGNKDE